MKKKEIQSILISLGWEAFGEKFSFKKENLLICIIPIFKKLTDKYVFRTNETITTEEYSKVYSYIVNENYEPSPIFRKNSSKFYSAIPFNKTTIELILKDILFSYEDFNIESEIKKLIDIPTDSKGTSPLKHISALSFFGEIEKLELYKNKFENDDRLGFIPYINIEHINRALEVCRKIES